MADSENEQAAAGLTQQNYRGTPYNDQTWEVIGEIPDSQIFIPLEIEVLKNEIQVDPMFADYGGRMQTNEPRWQLPDASTQTREPAEDERIIQEEELQRMLAEAEERGRKAALEEAAQLQNEKLSKIESSLNNVLSDMQKQFSEQLMQVERYALDLSLAVSEKLLQHVVEINPEYIAQVLNEAIALCGSANIRKIRVSPQDLEFIQIVGVSKQLKQKEITWEFEADNTIKAGCVIETSAGEVEYDLEKSFARIKESVLKVKDDRTV